MTTTIILNNTTESKRLEFDREKPFCKLINVELLSEINQTELRNHPISLQNQIIYIDGIKSDESLGSSINPSKTPLDLRNAKEVWLSYWMPDGAAYDTPKIRLTFEIMEKLDISIPTVGFDNHLNDPRNIKVLFSAKFGQGKTTFLNQFFDERLDQYNVFKLFPVNYSVATNQDIFKYIKSDILIQLLERTDVEFNKITEGYSTSFYNFFKKYPEKVLAPFLLMMPKIGKDIHGFYKQLTDLKDAFFNYHKKLNLNESELGANFVQNLIEEEGSIYEDNFFTQLIRSLLVQLKENDSDKENVLIIDDLDRMDPDHIFRILNVLSAHYDIFSQDTTQENNKFGFDRIILVGDYENIQHIYEYRYGEKVDFAGYFNKYFSTEIFRYRNNEVMEKLLFDIDGNKNESYLNELYFKDCFRLLMKLLIQNNLIALRDVLKMKELTLVNKREKIKLFTRGNDAQFLDSPFYPAIFLLSEIRNLKVLIEQINSLKNESQTIRQGEMNVACLSLLIGRHRNLNYEKISIEYQGMQYDIFLDYDSLQGFFPTRHKCYIKAPNNELEEHSNNFIFEQFKELLISNIERFIEYKQII